jgi:hypothetical protein
VVAMGDEREEEEEGLEDGDDEVGRRGARAAHGFSRSFVVGTLRSVWGNAVL